MKEMYKGKVNSPATLLVETIDSSVTSIKVADGSVFPEGPNVAVIGTDGNAETIKYDSINGNILVGCVRGFQGKASVWDKDTIIARNFTEYDLDVLQENILELDNNKVDKKSGQGLISDSEKNKLENIEDGANKYVHPSSHPASMITENSSKRFVSDSEKEKWNDKVSQSQITGDVNASGSDKVYHVDFIQKQFDSLDTGKADKDEIPTKISQLNNDKNFKTEAEIKTLINNSTKLKKEVVTSLPSTGKDNVIYLLKNKNDTNNYYTEYMWISGRWEIIGDTKVDLSDYAKKSEIPKIDLSKLDEKYLQYKSKMLEDIDLNTFDEYGIFLCNANACKNPPEYFIDSWFPFYLINEYIIGSDGTKSYYQLAIGMTNSKCVYARQGNKGSWTNWIPLVEEKFTKEEKEKLKKLSSSRSATFVIANYDSSENSKAGADYVIQKNDCTAEIINSFIGKLPNYGGKIQLTEGNFNIKKPISINFTKNNTIIEGYGDSTNIIDKLTKDVRNSVIVNISNGIINCRLSDLNITHETSNSINIRGNKNYFKNLSVINNGGHPSVYFGDNTRENMFENCNIKCNASYSYWIPSTSESNTLLCCSAESTESNANPFCIEGKNNIISNCYGKTIGAYVFNISGESNQFSNCAAVSNITAFQIQGSNNQLSHCRGVANKYDGISTDKTAKDILITNCIGISQSGDGVSIGGNNVHVSNTFGISNNGDGITTSPGSQRCIIVNCVAKTSNKSEKGMLALGDTHVFMGNIIYGKDNIYSSSIRLKQNNVVF